MLGCGPTPTKVLHLSMRIRICRNKHWYESFDVITVGQATKMAFFKSGRWGVIMGG